MAVRSCPRAVVVGLESTFALLELSVDVAFQRRRIVRVGEEFHLSDRTLRFLSPLYYDSPTIAVHDTRTELLWSADAFGMHVDDHIEDAAEITVDAMADGLLSMLETVAPWVPNLRRSAWLDAVLAIEKLDLSCIAGSHGAAIRGTRIREALEVLRRAPGTDTAP